MDSPKSDIRISALAPKTILGGILKFFAPLLDWILGINKLRAFYEKHDFSGLEKQVFSDRFIKALGVKIIGGEDILNKIPETGRFIVVCNHPYGMIEGLIIANLLSKRRKDVKIMANLGLQIFKEIQGFFIFANPLKPKSPTNPAAIKQCFHHLESDGLLVLFPAGRVSFYQANKRRITDGEWNRLPVKLAKKTGTSILPIFISGQNSRLFYRMGRIYYRFRLLMLAREMFKIEGREIKILANNILDVKILKGFKTALMMNDFIRVQCYLNDKKFYIPWPDETQNLNFKTIIPPVEKVTIKKELDALPEESHLVEYKNYSVYCGYQKEIPETVKEISRLREITFRDLDEGSGEERDTDKFDATYMHLFLYDNKNEEIIGAYRIGLTDILLKDGDLSQLYLSLMFNFEPGFVNRSQPCLEMGRSFIVESHQKGFHGLLLLWKGIGAFVSRNPRYRTLYGTVSLSKLYDPRSVMLINKIMVSNKAHVNAKIPFKSRIHPELIEFIDKNNPGLNVLSALVRGVESDGKDIPILLKQYHKLGAKFHCVGIDPSFNQTPGLLLSVHLPSAPDKLLNLYLGDKKDGYLSFKA